MTNSSNFNTVHDIFFPEFESKYHLRIFGLHIKGHLGNESHLRCGPGTIIKNAFAPFYRIFVCPVQCVALDNI